MSSVRNNTVQRGDLMNVTTSTRDIKELNPLVQVMLNKAISLIKKKGISPLIVETYRPKERQYYLYGKGRSYSTCLGAGVPAAYAQKYAKPNERKCTWTLNSIHIKRCAVDIVPQRGGQAIWNVKDVQSQEIIKIMQSVGFEAGANWKSSPDSPHHQVKGISPTGKSFSRKNTTKYVTTMIQKRLKKLGLYADYAVDGDWGKATDAAVKKWNKLIGQGSSASIGVKSLTMLLDR